MKSCFEGCCLEGRRCKDMALSSWGVFASFEALALEALTDMCFIAHLAVCWYKSNSIYRQVGREGEGASYINVRFWNCVWFAICMCKCVLCLRAFCRCVLHTCFEMCAGAVFTLQAFMFMSTCCSYQILITVYIHLVVSRIPFQCKLAVRKRHARATVTKDVTSVTAACFQHYSNVVWDFETELIFLAFFHFH